MRGHLPRRRLRHQPGPRRHRGQGALAQALGPGQGSRVRLGPLAPHAASRERRSALSTCSEPGPVTSTRPTQPPARLWPTSPPSPSSSTAPSLTPTPSMTSSLRRSPSRCHRAGQGCNRRIAAHRHTGGVRTPAGPRPQQQPPTRLMSPARSSTVLWPSTPSGASSQEQRTDQRPRGRSSSVHRLPAALGDHPKGRTDDGAEFPRRVIRTDRLRPAAERAGRAHKRSAASRCRASRPSGRRHHRHPPWPELR